MGNSNKLSILDLFKNMGQSLKNIIIDENNSEVNVEELEAIENLQKQIASESTIKKSASVQRTHKATSKEVNVTKKVQSSRTRKTTIEQEIEDR